MWPKGFAVIVIAFISVITLCNYGNAQTRSFDEHEEEDETLDLERRLAVLNKPPIKSFETDYGVIDCIDIYKQPAFDNPLLKNHKLQKKPSHLPIRKEKKSFDSKRFQYLNQSGISCPEGTVPIQRTTKEDLIREKSSAQLQDYDPFTSKDPNTYYAVVKLKKLDRPYVHAKASFCVYMPKSDTGELSGAQIWVYGGGGTGNYISAGWMVHPDLYGDPLTHLTGFWKGDGGAGCYNTKCPGFVQTYTDGPIGLVLKKISSYGGPLWSFHVSIFQDVESKNWWLASGEDFIPVGYWPKELFSQLGGGASSLAYGGVTKAVPSRVTPPMGSGIADCDVYHTAFIEDIQYKTDTYWKWTTPDWDQTEVHVDCPDVYTVQHDCLKRKVPTFTFMYGGAGGVC